jgi:hypothetical protein
MKMAEKRGKLRISKLKFIDVIGSNGLDRLKKKEKK